LPLAGLARRLASATYEALLVAALALLVGFLLLPLTTPGAAGAEQPLPIPGLGGRILLFAALFGTGALYFGTCWTGGRQTLPMKTWRLRVVDCAGAPLRWPTAFARYCAAWIGPAIALATYVAMKPFGLAGVAVIPLGLNYLAALVDHQGQFLHDRIAATRIVQDA
jgi:uncharacterized RDD family membrane protein YckC